MIDSAG